MTCKILLLLVFVLLWLMDHYSLKNMQKGGNYISKGKTVIFEQRQT